jgi:hypothetical protein
MPDICSWQKSLPTVRNISPVGSECVSVYLLGREKLRLFTESNLVCNASGSSSIIYDVGTGSFIRYGFPLIVIKGTKE